MKKVINIILLVVLGVSLSGCEWPGFGVDGGSDNPLSVDVPMTKIAQCGCEGKIVDIISFCKANGEIDSTIQTIQIEDSLVTIKPMEINGDYFEMNITINKSPYKIKYNKAKRNNPNNSPDKGIKISYKRKAVISNVGIKEIENNYDTTVTSEFFLWDVFEDNTGTYVVLSASENTNIQCGAHTGKILENDSVEKIINDKNRVNGKDYYEISVMEAMNGVGKMGYVIDNRVYLKNSLGNWNYYCNYSYSNLYITSKCVTMIVMQVIINEESKDKDCYFSTTNKKNKYYFNQSQNKPANSRYYIASWN